MGREGVKRLVARSSTVVALHSKAADDSEMTWTLMGSLANPKSCHNFASESLKETPHSRERASSSASAWRVLLSIEIFFTSIPSIVILSHHFESSSRFDFSLIFYICMRRNVAVVLYTMEC